MCEWGEEEKCLSGGCKGWWKVKESQCLKSLEECVIEVNFAGVVPFAVVEDGESDVMLVVDPGCVVGVELEGEVGGFVAE